MIRDILCHGNNIPYIANITITLSKRMFLRLFFRQFENDVSVFAREQNQQPPSYCSGPRSWNAEHQSLGVAAFSASIKRLLRSHFQQLLSVIGDTT